MKKPFHGMHGINSKNNRTLPHSIISAHRNRSVIKHHDRKNEIHKDMREHARAVSSSMHHPSTLQPVLHLFSGINHPDGLRAHLRLHGIKCVDYDKNYGDKVDLTKSSVVEQI